MPGPDWEDLSVFLSENDFGVEAVVRFAEGRFPDAHPVVIYDEAFLDPELGEYQTESLSPRMQGRTSELAMIRRGDEVEIGGQIFDVLTGAQPDGTGWAVVQLAPRG